MKKSVLALVTILITAISIIAPVNVFADSVPNQIRVTTTPPQPGFAWYIEDLYVGSKRTENGQVAYCLDYNLAAPSYTIVNRAGEMDAGMAYIIENGFPIKNITGDSNKDYYITQVAVWWYLDLTAGGQNLQQYQKNSNSVVVPYIKNLVNGAIAARNRGYVNPAVTASVGSNELKKNGDFYISEEITVNTTNLDNYKAALVNAPQGSFTADINGNRKEVFAQGEKLRVYIPAASLVNQNVSFKVNLSGTKNVNKVHRYFRENAGEQDILLAVLYPEPKATATELVLNANYEVEVPNTSSNLVIMYIIGGLLIISGLGFVTLYAKKQNK